ncbi:MAG: tRNA lysidine(34) synthetase TilS, partial [Proteobacteria bacterium]|nr:tRNA lysidine(34) synthetase TilS [Pseudomonadota bacterium]
MPELLLNHSSLNDALAANTAAKRWCVALSGGPDSTVLLHLLCEWRAEHPSEAPALLAIHINHHMQADADSWQAHCETLCSSWNVPLIVRDALVQGSGQGEEAAARQARYQLFEVEIGAGDILFMGHHLDDQVETYFLRLMRGSGLSGLSAMPAQRALGGGQLIRPLLKIERSALAAYASAHQLQSIQDPSNLDTSLDRNYLRQEVLPLLARRWSGYRQTVARAAEHAAVSQAVVNECLPAPGTVRSALGDPGIEQRVLNALSPEAAMITLRNWLRSGALPMPDQL